MQTIRYLMIPTQSNGSQTCVDTSSHNYVPTTKLSLIRRFLATRRARNNPFRPSPLAYQRFPPLSSGLSPSITGAKSRPQLHSSAHHYQRLPSSLLIENASEQSAATSAPCPEAFPIKANDFSDKWISVS